MNAEAEAITGLERGHFGIMSHNMTPRPNRPWATLAALFFSSFLVYNLNGRTIESGDTMPARLLPFNILVLHEGIFMDQFQPYARADGYPFAPGFGHVVSAYPILLPLLITPFYLPAIAFRHLNHLTVSQIMTVSLGYEKFFASLIAALGVCAFFSVAIMLSEQGTPALIATIVYGFATNVWATSSQALWQHGFGALVLLLSLLVFLRLEKDAHRSAALLCGILASLAVLERVDLVTFTFPLAVAIFLFRRELFFSFAAVPVAIAAASSILMVLHHIRYGILGRTILFGSNAPGLHFSFVSLAGVLMSPSRGLLFFSPVLAFALFGAGTIFRKSGEEQAWRILAFHAAAQVLLVSAWISWWGGQCFGPRLMVDALPAFCLFLIPAWPKINASRIRLACFGIAFVYSIMVQAVGAFGYPRGYWDSQPKDVDFAPQRLWDLRDNQIIRTAKVLFKETPWG